MQYKGFDLGLIFYIFKKYIFQFVLITVSVLGEI